MTNKKIVQEGIVTPQIDLGDQAASSTIVYDSGSDTVTINSSLTVSGTTTTVDTIDLNIADNMIVLNSGEAGSGVGGGAGTSGVEIDRGLLDNARLYFDEAAIEWRFAQADATNTPVASSATPTNNDHLTPKLYVDTEITNAIGTVDELREMGDVDIDDVPGGLPPAWVAPSGGWDGYSLAYDDASSSWMARLIPPGIAYLTVTSADLDIGNAPGDDSLNGVMQNGGTAYQIDLKDITPTLAPADYASANITVDPQGRVTFAEDGDVFQTIVADVGAPYIASGIDAFKISGGVGMTSTLVGSTATVSLNDTAVTPGMYTAATVTVNSQGLVTFAADGSSDIFKYVSADLGNNPVANGPSDTLNIVGGTGMYTSGDLGSDTIAVHLDNTGVGAGSYFPANITVNAQGQLTAASTQVIGTGNMADNAVTTAKIGHAGANLTLNTNGAGAPVWESQPTPSGYTFVGTFFVPIIPISVNESFSRLYSGINVGNYNDFYDNYLVHAHTAWSTYWAGHTPEGYEVQWDKQQKFLRYLGSAVITPPRSVQSELSWTWSVNNVSGGGLDVLIEMNQVTFNIYKPIV